MEAAWEVPRPKAAERVWRPESEVLRGILEGSRGEGRRHGSGSLTAQNQGAEELGQLSIKQALSQEALRRCNACRGQTVLSLSDSILCKTVVFHTDHP